MKRIRNKSAILMAAVLGLSFLMPASASAAAYTVQWGDTLSAIARSNDISDWRELAEANSIAGSIIYAGQSIDLPTATGTSNRVSASSATSWRDNPNNCTSSQWIAAQAPYRCINKQNGEGASAATVTTTAAATRSYYDGNTYPAAWANCTWYVDYRIGVPNYLGNASNWRWSLPAHGYQEVSARAGSIVVIDPWAAGHWAGHVAYVESVNANGTINVSESYYGRAPGVYYRTLTPNSGYHFFVL